MPAQANEAPIGVVVITAPEDLNQEWIDALQGAAGIDLLARLGVVQRGIELIQHLQPTVLIIDRSVDEIEETLPSVYAVAPQTLCIAVLPQQDMAAVRRLTPAGARDILSKPLGSREVIESVRRVVRAEEERRRQAQLPSLLANRGPAEPGKVIVVLGPKGGVGTTTVATNVAVALKQVSGKEVALADFSLQFGDVAVFLNLWSKHTLYELAVHYQTLDDTLLQRVMVEHGSGVKVIQAPDNPEVLADLSGPQISAIVDALAARFSFVVIDCWSFLDEVTLTLATLADQVLLVTTPEVPTLKTTKQALEYMLRRGVKSERIVLVLNRFPSVPGIEMNDIQEHLRHPIQANLPSDGPAVIYAANQGVPVVQSHPQSWVAQSFLRLAAWLAGDKVETISRAPAASKVATNGASQPAKRRFGLRRSSS